MGENSLSVTGNVTVTEGRTMVITNVGFPYDPSLQRKERKEPTVPLRPLPSPPNKGGGKGEP